MDVRRFVTVTKSELVKFLASHLNSAEFTDLWSNVGQRVAVSVARPRWALSSDLPCPAILLQKVGAETEFSNVSTSQYIAEGYWKDMLFELHCCTDESTGGRVTVDDLSSSVEVIFAQYSAELQSKGILVWTMEDGGESDENAVYENVLTLTVRVLVPGANLEPERLELGRFQWTAPGFGHFYAGSTLNTPQHLEAVLLNATSSSDGVATVTARNQLNALVALTVDIPRASAQNTVLALTGGNPDDTYVAVTSIEATGGQAGYLIAVYNSLR